MLEKMNEFFDARINGYEEHMLNNIESAQEFYPFTASLLPADSNVNILDLGCGTGLELDYYFKLNPNAQVIGIDLASGMLAELNRKHYDKKLTLINGSYFDIPFPVECYDACVSVESLHHFTEKEKSKLYEKVFNSLKKGGYFILTDYFAKDDEYEERFMNELVHLKKEQGISDNGFYHYDTPLTVEHESRALRSGGFSKIEVINNWGATYTIKATK